MKFKLLIGILLFSVLLNAGGIVFLILFLNEHGHYKSARKEKALLEHNLAVVQSGQAIDRAMGSETVEKRTFVSNLDGVIDKYAFQPPRYVQGALDYVLVVYLHGMGSNFMEPFGIPAEQPIASAITAGNPRVAILSLSHRKEAAWGNDQAVSDIVQNIREIMQEYPFKSIVLMGTSMGGCVALNFAATAPDDIKSKISGVVAVESAGDLMKLCSRTKTGAIRPAMMMAFGGAPDQVEHIYHAKSFLYNIDRLSHDTRIYMVSARDDGVVPPELQRDVIEQLNKRSIPNHLDEVDGPHEAPPARYYLRGLKFALGEQLQ